MQAMEEDVCRRKGMKNKWSWFNKLEEMDLKAVLDGISFQPRGCNNVVSLNNTRAISQVPMMYYLLPLRLLINIRVVCSSS